MIDLLHGDCLAEMRRLPAESFDSVVTDPPYSSGTRREGAKGVRKSMNRGRKAGDWFDSDSLTTTGFVWLMRECAMEWKRLLKPGGHLLVFIDWRMMAALSGAIESADLRNAGLLVWDKTYFGMGACFRNQHELILHFTKGVGAQPQRRDIGNVLQCKPIRGGEHPTEKPADLLERLVSVVTPEGGRVLDCFMGSGSTGVAAKRSGRAFTGIECGRPYFELARARLQGVERERGEPDLFAAS